MKRRDLVSWGWEKVRLIYAQGTCLQAATALENLLASSPDSEDEAATMMRAELVDICTQLRAFSELVDKATR